MIQKVCRLYRTAYLLCCRSIFLQKQCYRISKKLIKNKQEIHQNCLFYLMICGIMYKYVLHMQDTDNLIFSVWSADGD